MKNKVTLTIFFLSIFSIQFFLMASAETPQIVSPGVVVGDVFQYNYNVSWGSTDANLAIPNDVAELNQTQSFQITITEISGTTVSAEVIITYRNGSTNTQTGFVDVESGSIRLPYGELIVAGNLNANDRIYPSGGDATINYTSSRSYQSGSRETNERLVETTSVNHFDKTDVYYDKTKGIVVSSYYESIDTYGSETETFTETIINTNANVWTATTSTPPKVTADSTGNPTSILTSAPTSGSTTPQTTFISGITSWLILTAAIIAVVALIILAFYRRKRKPKTQQTQTPYLGTY